MALNAAVLRDLIFAKVTAKVPAANLDPGDLAEFAEAIAEAVIDHIKANGVVTTACGAGAGTGTIT